VKLLGRLYRLPEQLAVAVPTFAAALAVSVKVLSVVFRSSLVPGAVCALIITALIMLLAGPRRTQPHNSSSRASTLGDETSASLESRSNGSVAIVWLIQLMCVAIMVRALGVTLVPRIRSSDFGGHAGLTTWIVDHRGLPNSTVWPVGMSNYPPGSHVLPALLSWISGRSPLEMLWLVAVLGAVGQWPLLVLMTRAVSRTYSWWVGLSVLMFAFLAFRFTVGMISADFFFAQMIGQWMALASATWMVTGQKQLKRFGQWIPGSLVCAAGSFVAYPQVSVVGIGAAVAVVVAMPMSRRARIAVFGVPVALGVVGLLALSRTVYWSSELLAGGPGATVKPTVRLLGGPLTLLFAVYGLALMLSRLRRDRFVAPVVGALLGPLAVIAAMMSLRNGFPVRLAVSDYRVIKNIFPLVPFGLVAAALGAERFGLWLLSGFTPATPVNSPIESKRMTALVGLGVVGSLLVADPVRSGTRPVYDRQAYELGRTLPEGLRLNNVGLAGPWVEVAVMRWVGIGPLVTNERPVEFPRSNQWKSWPDQAVPEDYLLVSGSFVQVYAKRPGVTIVKRHGGAALLKRSP
jgi:hypothetical protein